MTGKAHKISRLATGIALAATIAAFAAPAALASSVPDGRSPDTRDAALQAHNPVVTVVTPNGFAWDDFGIGFAAAAGSMLLLAGLRVGVHAARRREPVTGSAASV